MRNFRDYHSSIYIVFILVAHILEWVAFFILAGTWNVCVFPTTIILKSTASINLTWQIVFESDDD